MTFNVNFNIWRIFRVKRYTHTNNKYHVKMDDYLGLKIAMLSMTIYALPSLELFNYYL